MMTIVDIFDKQPVISKGALDAIYAIRVYRGYRNRKIIGWIKITLTDVRNSMFAATAFRATFLDKTLLMAIIPDIFDILIQLFA